MAAGALYGAFLFTLMSVLTTVFPPVVGWLVFWAALSVQLSAGAVVMWRRTRLPLMTTGFVVGASASAVFAATAARGVLPQEFLMSHPFLAGGLIALPPGLLYSEAWLRPNTWRQVKRRSREATFVEILTFRHIPDLRTEPGR
jgi:hypothetical protein